MALVAPFTSTAFSQSSALVTPFTPTAFPQSSPSVAQGLLALLEEDEPELQQHALEQLYKIVDQHWAEVANKVPLIEAISEDPKFAKRELAAAVASRCFFHLEEYNDALRLALGAGPHFDVAAAPATRSPPENQYVDTLVSKCIGMRRMRWEYSW